jgi:hypothetical protein
LRFNSRTPQLLFQSRTDLAARRHRHVSRAAPAKVNATLMGLAFMSLFVSNNLIGWIGGFYVSFAARLDFLVIWIARRFMRIIFPSIPIFLRS